MKKTAITDYRIKINRTEAGTGTVRAVYITDLHNAVWNNDPDCLPGIIEGIRPDLILCGGDMIVAHPRDNVKAALYFMNRMLDIAPVCFGLGNHEFRSRIYPETYGTMYGDFMDPLLERGMILLDNGRTDMSVNGLNLAVYGLSIPRANYRRFQDVPLQTGKIRSLIGSPDRERVSILLAHNPKYCASYLKWGADLTLCGHYHGGIAGLGKNRGLVSPGLEPFPAYARGSVRKGEKTLIISSGLGEHTVPVRINNPRELVRLEITAGQTEQ